MDGVEVAPYWNVNYWYNIFINSLVSVEVAPYWNVNVIAHAEPITLST